MWRKSSYSASANCVEVAWRKSSRSMSNGDCVEVADTVRVLVRDSKDPGPVLSFTRADWAAFTDALKRL